MLCQSCRRILPLLLEESFGVWATLEINMCQDRYRHHGSLYDLGLSVIQGCRLCRFLHHLFQFPIEVWTNREKLPGGILFFQPVRFRNVPEIKYVLERKCDYTLSWNNKLLFPKNFGIDNTSPLYRNPACRAALTLAKRWINTCLESHEMCRNPTLERFRPTRLVDVRSIKFGSHVRLVETQQSFMGNYVALSYCWGTTKRDYLLTTYNLSSYLNGIPIWILPRTIQDAITIVKGLGVRYMWVDALCIIQDSVEDWERESATMGCIYKQASCTIAASVSSSSEGGFLRKRESFKCHKTKLMRADLANIVKECRLIEQSSQVNFHARDYQRRCLPLSESLERVGLEIFPFEPEWTKHFAGNPLNTRGWALQERHLSTRVLHYTREGFLWECNSLHASEQCPDYNMALQDSGIMRLFDNIRGHDRREIYKAWFDMLSDYTERRLSKDCDRLPALSGIAGEMEQLMDDRYKAGLWESNITECLLWSSVGNCTRPSTYLAPSWSWAAVKGKVDYCSMAWAMNYLNPRPTEYAFATAKIQEIETTPVGIDRRGRIASGHIRLSGRLRRTRCMEWRSRPMLGHYAFSSFRTRGTAKVGILTDADTGTAAGNLWLDVSGECTGEQILFCLCLDTQPSKLALGRYGIGLALRSTGKNQKEYSRIGIAYNMPLSWYETCPDANLKIV